MIMMYMDDMSLPQMMLGADLGVLGSWNPPC